MAPYPPQELLFCLALQLSYSCPPSMHTACPCECPVLPPLQTCWLHSLQPFAVSDLHLVHGLITRMGCCSSSAGAHLVPLASPTSGQKSSSGLTAQQTAAEAEQNVNVALLEREAKKVQGRRGFCHCLAPAGGHGGGRVAHRGGLGGSFSTPSPPSILEEIVTGGGRWEFQGSKRLTG